MRDIYWMRNPFLYAPDGAGGGAENPAAGADANNPASENEPAGTDAGGEDQNEQNDLKAELAKQKAEMARMKAALDAATSEAGKYRKELRAKLTAEEIAAEEKKAADEAAKLEIETLRKEVARGKTVKAVMSRLGTDEDTSGRIADYLYGAEDAEAALGELQKAWMAREKALRLEFGKVPPPGAGGQNGEDAAKQKAINLAKEIGRERAISGKSVKDSLAGYVR